ncbi:MAG: hypothetical protein IKF90_22110 [Parasporobacterium sp.]|nr:hypothetical protein [Parasporobacterium sp.]
MSARADSVFVCLGEKTVGMLAETLNPRVAFAYSPECLEIGFPETTR